MVSYLFSYCRFLIEYGNELRYKGLTLVLKCTGVRFFYLKFTSLKPIEYILRGDMTNNLTNTLERLSHKRLTPKDSVKVKSLKSWLSVKGSLSVKQVSMLRAIENKYVPKKPKGDYFLYVISKGDNIKIGLSKDPLKAVNASKQGDINLISKIPVGSNLKLAQVQERKVLNQCKGYKSTDGWFHSDCLSRLSGLKVKSPNGRIKSKEYYIVT